VQKKTVQDRTGQNRIG
jgi:hypothetical protein